MAVGKEIMFSSTHSLPPNEDVPRDFGTAEIAGVDPTVELLKNGWAKVKELKREPTEEDIKKKGLESEAKVAEKGLWNPHELKVRIHVLFHLVSSSSYVIDRRVSSTTQCQPNHKRS
jgi:staphylococcal nuclease domain-containing protein 1